MFLTDALRTLLRMWWLTLFGLAVTGMAGIATFAATPRTYRAAAQIVILPPAAAARAGAVVNPFADVKGGFVVIAALVAGEFRSPEQISRMAADGPLAPYTVEVLPDTGPRILLDVKSSDPALALATRQRVLDAVDVTLADVQTRVGLPDRQFATARAFLVGSEAAVVPGGRLRAAAGVAAAGGLVTLITVFAADRLRRRLATRARPRRGGRSGQPHRTGR